MRQVCAACIRRVVVLLACGAGFLLAAGHPGTAQADLSRLTRIGTDYDSPMFVTSAPGDPDRLYVVERSGAIQVMDRESGADLGTFLTIPDTEFTSGFGEYGLLGMAFHPNYQENGKFYTYLTVDNDNLSFQGASADFSTHVREYTADSPTSASLASEREIFQAIQPQNNHNGGWIGFSPNDGYLYIASGDGGAGFDNGSGHTPGTGNAQDITNNPLGKMLRLDVDGDDFPGDDDRNYAIPESNPFVGVTGDDEIWAYGLRNPWRNSFDRMTGDLWIGDVGQGTREEINFQPADAEGGRNYGWRLREGDIETPGAVGGDRPEGAIDPVYDYSHGFGTFQGNSTVGGYLYRGPDPELQGQYFFADTVSGNLWSFDPTDPDGTVENIEGQLPTGRASLDNPVSYGEDDFGNLYIVDLDGDIFRVTTDALVPGDYNGDGAVNGDDYGVWLSEYGAAASSMADGNGDGVVDAGDYIVWRDNLGATAQTFGQQTPLADATPAPEPAAALLCVAGALGLAAGRRRHRAKGGC